MSTTEPVLVRATEAEVLSASGVTLFADVPDTGGHLTSHRSIFKPGKEGAPPHLHREASELFFVLTGSPPRPDRRRPHHPGRGRLPRRPAEHPARLRGRRHPDAEVLFVLTHAKPRFDYYRLLESVYRGETDPAELAKTSDLYDNHYVESPAWQDR